MGQDKALLSWCGTPLYLHMANVLKQAGIEKVLVNGPHQYPDTVQDIIPGRGPLSGVHAALHSCTGGTLLIVPVDMPLLSPVDMTRLVSSGDGEYPLQFEGYSLPLLLPVHKASREAAEQAIASDNRKHYALWRLMEKLGGKAVPAPDGHQQSFCNTNTPQDWQEVKGEQ